MFFQKEVNNDITIIKKMIQLEKVKTFQNKGNLFKHTQTIKYHGIEIFP